VSERPTKRPALADDPTTVGELSVAGPIDRARKPFLLEQIKGPGAPRSFTLELAETVIGRSAQAHICIESTLISRQHLCVRKNGPQFTCVDLDSANGLYLNGIKAHSALLHEGDTLQIGDVVLVFHEGS
jgi:pSer/pThr/pTyr-binding forkhead associated (FHA) protein